MYCRFHNVFWSQIYSSSLSNLLLLLYTREVDWCTYVKYLKKKWLYIAQLAGGLHGEETVERAFRLYVKTWCKRITVVIPGTRAGALPPGRRRTPGTARRARAPGPRPTRAGARRPRRRRRRTRPPGPPPTTTRSTRSRPRRATAATVSTARRATDGHASRVRPELDSVRVTVPASLNICVPV